MEDELLAPETTDVLLPSGEILRSVERDGLVAQYGADPVAEWEIAFAYRHTAEEIEAHAAEALATLTGKATPEERDTWPAKERLAEAWLKRGDPDARDNLAGMVPVVLAQAEGLDPNDAGALATYIARKIMAKAAVMYAIMKAVSRSKAEAYTLLEAAKAGGVPAIEALREGIAREAEARLEQYERAMREIEG